MRRSATFARGALALVPVVAMLSIGCAGDDGAEWVPTDSSRLVDGGYGEISDGLSTSTSPATTLAAGQPAPRGIAVHGDRVFWLNQGEGAPSYGAVATVAIAGGAATTLVSRQMSELSDIVVDGAHVYWAGDSIRKVPLAGGAPSVLANQHGAAIAVDDARVYWTADRDGMVMMVPLEGGSPEALAVAQDSPAGIALDATHVYWTNRGDGLVLRAPIAGGSSQVLASSQDVPFAIAVDADAAYWSESTRIMSVPLDGGEARQLATVGGTVVGLVLDATSLYWAEGVAARCPAPCEPTVAIRKVPLHGGAVVTLASGASGMPQGIASDETRVYWTRCGDQDDCNDGTVMSVLKAPASD